MKNEEAKFILQAYRHNGQDAEDVCFQEALKQVKEDPELQSWFSEEKALDEVVSSKLLELEPPKSLKQNILTGSELSRRPSIFTIKHGLMIAAALVLMIGLSTLWFPFKKEYDHTVYTAEMADFLSHKLDGLEIYSHELVDIQRYLREAGLDGDIVIPAGLHNLTGIGCRILAWKGQEIALICFRQEDDKVIHLLVMEENVFPQIGETPQFAKVDTWTMAIWNRDSKHYLLAGGPGLSQRL